MLSEVIGSVRIGRIEACSIKERGRWEWRCPPLTVRGFHIVLPGSAWLITAAGPPVELTPADVVPTPYCRRDRPARPLLTHVLRLWLEESPAAALPPAFLSATHADDRAVAQGPLPVKADA
ncbi:cupin domain-containing protein [Streptomyces avermitilis]|uniref:cupin domain-containing protein n=1 Tax=Streptomyces avermitilis TaxID=33903 RepID=UPI0033B7F166